MDYDWNEDQQAIREAVETLCAQHAGPERAIELNAKGSWDEALDAALVSSGFAEVALGAPDTGTLEAAMLVEVLARAAATAPVGAQLLVAPALTGSAPAGPVALASLASPGPVRFGAQARVALLDTGGDEARRVELAPGDAKPVASNFMLPFARLELNAGSGESLGAGSGPRLRAWWRVALAAELLGSMQAALDLTVDYAQRRRQFGRPIGSFQALQHRLAQCAVLVEGSRRLTYAAAAEAAPDESACVAAAHAAEAANLLFRETHQMTGSMGFTREYDLHVFSLRLQALRLELGGASAHRRAIASARWKSPS